MAMSKKDFIGLADEIKEMFNPPPGFVTFTKIQREEVINSMADFCQHQNPRFNRYRWIDYIEGKCGPNGGRRK